MIMRKYNKEGIRKITKEWLIQKYINEQLSIKNIAKLIPCGITTLRSLMKKFKISIRYPHELHNLVGKQFNHLTVLAYEITNPKRQTGQLVCQCTCGKIIKVPRAHITNGVRQTCGHQLDEFKNNGSPCWKGSKYFSKTFWSRIKTRALKYNREFTISLQDLDNQLEKQNYQCRFTGEHLWFNKNQTNISVDRIDSNKGYTPDNIQLVLKNINKLKGIYQDEDFINICYRISQYCCNISKYLY